jgi:hypothetical protein
MNEIVTINQNKIMKQISRYIMTLVALFAMTAGAWAQEETVYNSSVDIRNLQPNDILIEGAAITGIESSYGLKLMPYFLQSQDDEHYSLQSSSQAIASSGNQVTILEGGVLERVRNSSRYTYTPCDADSNPFNAWIVTQIEDLGSDTYRVQITAYQYGSAEVEANVNPGEKTNLLEQFNKAKNSGLTVNVGSDDNAYSLNFDKEAIGSILEGNPEEVNLETTYEETKQKIGSTDVLAKLNVNLTNGSNALNFNAGKVVASLKFLGNIPTGRELQTWYFDNVSNLPTEMIPTVYDAVNKMATITMSHFSTYGLLLYTPAGMADLSDDATTATMEMPANDVTIEYELVRDMAINMTASVGDGSEDYRIRLKKEGDAYVLANLTVEEIMNFVKVYDQTEEKYLTLGTDFTTAIYAIDDNGQPTGDAIAFASLTPGRYVAIATAVDESNYAGTAPQSNVFVLYEAYELTVPAGEYVTYYCDEALTLDTDETAAELYTITEVSNEVATASKFDVIPANVPLLVKNTSDETRTIVLIPTEDPASFMWYEGFKGTLEATEIAASDDTADRYAFNGKQFVRVENALAVDANKAWLEIPAAANNARTINLVFGETTKITTTDFTDYTDGVFYDLNGRKLDKMPTRKGIYILNGKKVVVR